MMYMPYMRENIVIKEQQKWSSIISLQGIFIIL